MNQLVHSPQPSTVSDGERWTNPVPARPSSSEPEGPPIDILRLFVALRRRWWLILLITAIGGIVAWFADRYEPRDLTASSVVQLRDSRSDLAGDLVKTANRGSPSYLALTEVEIIKSRAIAYAVVDSEPLGLRVNAGGFSNSYLSDVSVDQGVDKRKIPVFFTAQGFRVGSDRAAVTPYGTRVSVAGVQFTVSSQPSESVRGNVYVKSRDRTVDRLLFKLSAVPRNQTNIIDITYSSTDGATATRVVNRVAKIYQTLDTRRAQFKLHRRRSFIEDQLARTDAQLGEADRALSAFRNRQQAYSSQDKFRSQQTALVSLDVRREQLDGDRKMVRSLLKKVETGDAATRWSALSMLATTPEVSERSPIPDLYKKLSEYQRGRLELTSGPSGKAATNPQVQRFDTLITSTQADLLSATRSYLALIDARVDALDEVRTRNAGTLEQLPAAEAAETRLQQNAEALREQAASLRAQYQQARIAEAAELGQVEIVDLAVQASGLMPKTARLVGFALFIAFMIGCGLAVLLEAVDRTLKRRDDVETSLQVPVLATIPRITTNGDSNGHKAAKGLTNAKAKESYNRRKVALTSITHSRAVGAEAFRHLRTNLLYSRAGASARRILITSPTEGDGKTSIASNLAITLASHNYRVLLVDCDMYGKLHTIFQLPASPGLSEVILDHIHPTDAFRQTGIPGLCVMTAGKPPQQTTDVVGSHRMEALLRDMTREFDLVILDCSPILALTDATILSVDSDVVLLVIRAGHTAANAAVEAMRQLETVGARVAGVVLNDPDDRARQYGGATYQYGYGYAAR